MKYIDVENIDKIPGIRLNDNDIFRFRCHAGLTCFNRCCRNINLFLYPYDVIRLKQKLGISSDEFLEKHTDAVLRPGNYFPEVLLRMAENKEKTCPFLIEAGCSVYSDRPDTCRAFPMEHGTLYDAATHKTANVHFFRPPDFCQGQYEQTEQTPLTYIKDHKAQIYHQMTGLWAEVKVLFQNDPWNGQGQNCSKAKMAFMAAYNIDRFREFVFNSSFLKRYKIRSDLLDKLKKNDDELLRLGFEWIKFYLWGLKPKYFRY